MEQKDSLGTNKPAFVPPPSYNFIERREHPRNGACHRVDVRVFSYDRKDKQKRASGLLGNTSVGGAWVTSPRSNGDLPRSSEGETVVLDLGERVLLPGKVIRCDEQGFAVEFDFSIDLRRRDFEI